VSALSGQVALITGGAGGIGRAIVTRKTVEAFGKLDVFVGNARFA
jgi:short-subunit dehydrogenase involved in D-alanine esterification of teichoic acids